MQDANEKELKKEFTMASLPLNDKTRFVGAFALLMKVDKRVNPHLYKPIKKTND